MVGYLKCCIVGRNRTDSCEKFRNQSLFNASEGEGWRILRENIVFRASVVADRVYKAEETIENWVPLKWLSVRVSEEYYRALQEVWKISYLLPPHLHLEWNWAIGCSGNIWSWKLVIPRCLLPFRGSVEIRCLPKWKIQLNRILRAITFTSWRDLGNKYHIIYRTKEIYILKCLVLIRLLPV